MTLIGIWVERDRALCWADTEGCLVDDTGRYVRSTGHHFKIAINEFGRFAAAGAGTAYGNASIAWTVSRAQSFDDFCSLIPDALREEAKEANSWPKWTCVAAGYSRRFRRMMGAVCRAASNFALSLSHQFAAPCIEQSWAPSVTGPLDLLPIARQQMQIVGEWGYPFAGGNKLIVADLNLDGVSSSAFDLVGGFELAKQPELPPMSDWQYFDRTCGGGGE